VYPPICPLEEEEPLEYDPYDQATFGSDGDPEKLGFDFGQQAQTHRYRDYDDPAQLQPKRKRRPQFPEQDLGLGARRVLDEQSLALEEDRHRTNSLESKCLPVSGAKAKGHTLNWSIEMAMQKLLIPMRRT
jgi:hypothetical protein